MNDGGFASSWHARSWLLCGHGSKGALRLRNRKTASKEALKPRRS